MSELRLHLAGEGATLSLGARLAPLLRAGDAICLSGPLGAGKTTLARGLIAALCGEKDAPSPTFPLVLTYEGPDFTLWHFDLYRLDRAEDAFELGLEDALAEGASLIEWPERISGLIPDTALVVRLEPDAGGGRSARLSGRGDWPARLARANLMDTRLARANLKDARLSASGLPARAESQDKD